MARAAPDRKRSPVLVPVERGAIAFLVLPGARRVERLWVVLVPEGRRPIRRLSVRRRRLPSRARGQRFYAHVDRIAVAPARLTEDLRAAGGGLAARVAAIGRYAIAPHRGHVHLAYAVARRVAPAELAGALGIAPEGAFVLSVFARSLPPTRRPRGDRPLAPATPARLDVLGAEVALLAGARPRDARLGIRAAAPDRAGDALARALAQAASDFTSAATRT